ncbi:TPR repeat-containing protein [Chitinispirillum alkaliphilum]|nr:TPR repeat-containing protein [Chitinispirillum alkaliphilum]
MKKEMKILAKAGLSAKEQNLLKKITLYSFIVCSVLVLTFWVTGSLLQRSDSGQRVRIRPPSSTNQLNSLDIQAHRFTAERLMQSNRYDEAIPHLQRVLAAHNRDTEGRIFLSEALLKAGHFDRALSAIETLLSEEPDDSLAPILLTRKGIALFYLGRHKQSLTILENCLKRYPDCAEALCFLGQIEASKQLPSERAVEYLQRSVEVDPFYVEGWYQLGRYYSRTGEYFKARRLFLKALEINPLHSRSHSRLGTVYYYMRNADLAKKSYQTALAINPYDFNTRYNLGEVYFNLLENRHNALYHYKRAIEKSPYHPDANFKAGIICMGNGMIKEAIGYFENSLKTERADIRKLLQLAAAYERLGDSSKALEVYQEIKEIDPLHLIANQKIRFLSRNL